MNDIKKLPAWAQHKINKLESDLAWAARQVRQLAASDNGPISWSVLDAKGGIPERALIYFKTTTGTIEVSLRDGALIVRSSPQTIAVAPLASNSVSIVAVPR